LVDIAICLLIISELDCNFLQSNTYYKRAIFHCSKYPSRKT